jgi:hypothetical protein
LIAFDVFATVRVAVGDPAAMTSWSDFETAAPDLAARVRERLDAHVHKTLATIRQDGAPRISGTEVQLRDGELWIGSMWDALKARDLQRDPRFALHSGSEDPPAWPGDAKLAGLAVEETDPELVERLNGHAGPAPSHLFRLDLLEVSTVATNADASAIEIELWTAAGGRRSIARA